MKTKHLFMTMALAAGFAACTSEDVIETSYTNEAARTVLDNIEFTLGEVESRFTLESGTGWGFNEGDAFGAALVDVTATLPKGSRAIDKYLLQNTIQSNYQYAYGEGGVWTTPARLVEGNYVFYAPFNEKHLSRKPIEIITPIAQTLDVNNGVIDTYSPINNAVAEGNPFFLAYEFLPAVGQETKLSLDFYSIFAYPKVTIKNNKTTDVTLTKVVIKLAEGDEFVVKAPLNVGTIDKVAYSNVGGVVGNLYNYGDYDKVKNVHGAWILNNEDTKSNGLVGETTDVLGTATASANVIVVDIPNSLEIAAGESASFNVVMPAQTYKDGIKVLAYINDGEGYELEIENGKSMTFFPNKLYPKEEYKNDNQLNQNKKGSMFTATISKGDDADDMASEFPVLVSTTEELEEAILEGESTLYVIPTSEEVAINASVYEAMRKSQFQGMTVAGDIKIIGSNDANNPLTLEENVKIEGLATVSGYVKTHAYNDFAGVEVAEEAVLTVGSTDAMEIINYGTTTIAVENATADVENFGTLNINKKNFAGDIAEGTEKNEKDEITAYYGTVNVNAAYAVANEALYSTWNFNADATFDKVSVCGTMTIAEDAELDGNTLTIEGGATLNVNGELEGDVELNGVNDDPTTTEDEYAEATLNLNETSSLIDEFAAAETSYGEANIVNVKDGASFFKMSSAKENVISWFVYTGNLNNNEDVEDLIVPEVCNSVKIIGNIAPEGDNEDKSVDLSSLSNDIKTLIIDGDIRIKKASKAVINVETVEVTGDIRLADQESSYLTDATVVFDLSNVKNLKVDGTVNMGANALTDFNEAEYIEWNNLTFDETLDITVGASVKRIILKGKVEAKGNIKANAKDNVCLLVLDGAEVTLAEDKVFGCGNVMVDNYTSLEGSGTYVFRPVKLLNGAVLTIDSGATLGKKSVPTSFEQLAQLTYEGGSGTKNGKVINNGTVVVDDSWVTETWTTGAGEYIKKKDAKNASK